MTGLNTRSPVYLTGCMDDISGDTSMADDSTGNKKEGIRNDKRESPGDLP